MCQRLRHAVAADRIFDFDIMPSSQDRSTHQGDIQMPLSQDK